MPFPALPKECMGGFLSHHESTIGESKLQLRRGLTFGSQNARCRAHDRVMILTRMMKNKNTKVWLCAILAAALTAGECPDQFEFLEQRTAGVGRCFLKPYAG